MESIDRAQQLLAATREAIARAEESLETAKSKLAAATQSGERAQEGVDRFAFITQRSLEVPIWMAEQEWENRHTQ